MTIKNVTYQITKKGRKWYEGIVPEKNWKAKILINEFSEGWSVGETITFPARVDVERCRYGTKVKVYPCSEEELKKERIEKKTQLLNQLKEEIKRNVESGWYPTNKATKCVHIATELEELGIKNIENETSKFLEESMRKAQKIKDGKKYHNLKKDILEGNLPTEYLKIKFENMKKLAENYKDLKEDLEQFEETYNEKLKEAEIREIKKTLNRRIERFEESVKARGYMYNTEYLKEIDALIKKLKLKGDIEGYKEYSSRVLEILDEQDRIWKEFYKSFNPRTLKFFKKILEIDDATLMRMVNKGLINPKEEYVEVFRGNPDWLEINMLKKYTKCKYYVSKEEEYIFFTTRDDARNVKDIHKMLSNGEKVYQILQKVDVDGEPLSDEQLLESLPQSWNHIKRQFVALIKLDENKELTLDFISQREDFTRSGANARLVVDGIPEENGTLLVSKDGSHKHMFITIFRKDEDGWKRLISTENGFRKSIEEIVDKYLSKIYGNEMDLEK